MYMSKIVCKFCKLEFEDYKSNKRKYCNHSCYAKARSSGVYPAYWQGKHFPDEVKEKWRQQRKGKKFSTRFGFVPKTAFKLGQKPWNWKGGITPENIKIRHSVEYKKWRVEVFKRDNFTCQICRVRGKYLEADHIKPFSLYPELRLDISNGRTLCKTCHKNSISTYLLSPAYKFPNAFDECEVRNA